MKHNALAVELALHPPAQECHPLGEAIRLLRSWKDDGLADQVATAWLRHDIESVEEHQPLTDEEADRIIARMKAGWPEGEICTCGLTHIDAFGHRFDGGPCIAVEVAADA